MITLNRLERAPKMDLIPFKFDDIPDYAQIGIWGRSGIIFTGSFKDYKEWDHTFEPSRAEVTVVYGDNGKIERVTSIID